MNLFNIYMDLGVAIHHAIQVELRNLNSWYTHDNLFCINVWYYLLYRGAWAIAMVTFHVPGELHAHNMPVDREI